MTCESCQGEDIARLDSPWRHSIARRTDGSSPARLTFKIACTGPNPMTGTGDFTMAADSYNGQIRLKGKMEGQDINMVARDRCASIGSCTAS